MNCKACLDEFLPAHKDQAYCNQLCRFFRLPFRSWDGEGITPDPNIKRHVYNILATYDGICDEDTVNEEGLSTAEIFKFLTQRRNDCINVWFAFDYDVNCILKGIPLRGKVSLQTLTRDGELRWRGWHITYVPGKIFSIRRRRQSFTSYDVFGYFQKSFIEACKDFGLDPTQIEEGKAARADFASWTTERVLAYNKLELRLLIQLMNKVRKALRYHAPKRQWYGPGAVASEWLKRQCKLKMDEHRTYPDEMMAAILHSYFGGRIDVSEIGEFQICHAYDIASAYPWAMTHIPRVKSWEYKITNAVHDIFGLYHVRWSVPRDSRWCPFPWRSPEGRILYPPQGEGWYFGCEVIAAKRLFRQSETGYGIYVLEAWEPVRDGMEVASLYPLRAHVVEAYNNRIDLKRKKDPSQLAYKLILNSMYGKFAQKRMRRTEDTPRWQNYVWAAFTTAYTRAMILDVIAKSPENVIAIATDSVFCHSPILPTTKDEQLGHWQYEDAYPTIIVMPGVYARFKPDGSVKRYKQRGFSMPLNYGHLLRLWGCKTLYDTKGVTGDTVKRPRFVTFRHAIVNGHDTFGYFYDEEKSFHNIAMMGFSKRFPDPFLVFDKEWITKKMAASPSPKSEPMSCKYRLPTFEEEVMLEEVLL